MSCNWFFRYPGQLSEVCRYPTRILARCQWFAGTLQVSWLAVRGLQVPPRYPGQLSEVCRFPACILTRCQGFAGTPQVSWPDVRGLQAPRRYPGQLSEVCRYPTRILASCQGSAGIRRYPGQLSEVCRYPTRILASCQGFAGTLQVSWPAVRGVQKSGYTESSIQPVQGASLGDFLLAPACPIEKVTRWVGPLYLTLDP